MNVIVHNDRCNLNCTYCLKQVKGSNKPLTCDFIDSILNKYPLEKIESVIINGYEPLMEFPIIEYLIKKHNLKIIFTTNGILVHGEIAKFLLENKNYFDITLSLDGNRETNDRNRGIGTYDMIDIDIFLELNTSINMTVVSNNIADLSKSIKHILNLGFKDVKFNLDFLHDFTSDEFIIYVKNLNELTHYYLENTLELPIRREIFVTSEKTCSLIEPKVNREYRYYDINGKEYPCFICQAYNIKPIIKKELSSKCGKCKILYLCANCIAKNIYQTGSHVKSPINCSMIKADLWFIYLVLSYRINKKIMKINQFQKDCMKKLFDSLSSTWKDYDKYLK